MPVAPNGVGYSHVAMVDRATGAANTAVALIDPATGLPVIGAGTPGAPGRDVVNTALSVDDAVKAWLNAGKAEFLDPRSFGVNVGVGIGRGNPGVDLPAFKACLAACYAQKKQMRVFPGNYAIGGYIHDLPVELYCVGAVGDVKFWPTANNQKIIDIRESVKLRFTENFRSRVINVGGWMACGKGFTGILGERFWLNTQLNVGPRAVNNCDLGTLFEATQYSNIGICNYEECEVSYVIIDDVTGTLRVNASGEKLDANGNKCSQSGLPQARDAAGGGINNCFTTQTAYNSRNGNPGLGGVIGRPNMPYPLGSNELINYRSQVISTCPLVLLGHAVNGDGSAGIAYTATARNRISMYTPEQCGNNPTPTFLFDLAKYLKYDTEPNLDLNVDGATGPMFVLPTVLVKRSLVHSIGAATEFSNADIVGNDAPCLFESNSLGAFTGGSGGGTVNVLSDDTSLVTWNGAAIGHGAYFENVDFGPTLHINGYATFVAVERAETVIDHTFPNGAHPGMRDGSSGLPYPMIADFGDPGVVNFFPVDDPLLGKVLRLTFGPAVGSSGNNQAIVRVFEADLAVDDLVMVSLLLRPSADTAIGFDAHQSTVVIQNAQEPKRPVRLKAGVWNRLLYKNKNNSGYTRNRSITLWPALASSGLSIDMAWPVALRNPTAKQMSRLTEVHRFNPKMPPAFPGA